MHSSHLLLFIVVAVGAIVVLLILSVAGDIDHSKDEYLILTLIVTSLIVVDDR